MGAPIEGSLDGNRNTAVQLAGLIGGPLIALLFITLYDMDPARPYVGRTAAVAFVMAAWWVTEAAPLAATSLLPVFMFPALGIMNGKDVATQYFNHVIFLFLGGFLVAGAMERWNLHRRIALNILIILGKSLGGILLGFMLATGLLSMWMSNTACAMIMLPIVLAVIVKLEELFGKERIGGYSKALLLSVAYGASIGGVATIVGTPPNAAFVKIFSIQFPNAPEITFAQFMAIGMPISITFLICAWGYLHFAFKPKGEFTFDRGQFRDQLAQLGPMKYEEKIMTAVFLSLVFLWIFREPIDTGVFKLPGWGGLFPNPKYLTDGASAVAMAFLLFLIPSKSAPGQRIMDWDAVLKLPWDIVLLFGGGFALAQGFEDSGLSMWVGEKLKFAGALDPTAVALIICSISTFLTEFTSNTATAQILLPIFASLAVAAKINPFITMIPATFGVSFAFMLPVGTPPNAIVFGSGRLRIIDMAKAGFIMNLIGIVIITAASLIFLPWIWGVDFGVFPAWAAK
jgi:sodium-dependent dicarboxylate transporter 2/3/5